MRRKCNLELSLVPPACVSEFSPNEYCNITPYFSMGSTESIEEQQQLTIFYDGKVVVSDATDDLQARAIIHIASKEMEKKTRTLSSCLEPPSPLLPSQSGVSMKKSLQRFLQKRKNRIQATSPYHH